jgi:uncharacterized membrane protein
MGPASAKLWALAQVGAVGGHWDPREYHRLSRRWELWGAVALLTPLAALVLMVIKPE